MAREFTITTGDVARSTRETCMAPVRWVPRLNDETKVKLVLQQLWEVLTFTGEEGYAVREEWRDVPVVLHDPVP